MQESIECCDVFFGDEYVGRSFADGYFAENILYTPSSKDAQLSDQAQEKHTAEVVGEFIVVSVNRVGIRQRLVDAARVLVRWQL